MTVHNLRANEIVEYCEALLALAKKGEIKSIYTVVITDDLKPEPSYIGSHHYQAMVGVKMLEYTVLSDVLELDLDD